MSYDIGPKIGIDGEAEFRKELNNINQQLRTLGSEMKAVTSSFAEGDKSEEALAAQTDVLNRQIDAQQQKLEQLQKGLDASAQKYGENDTRTLKWAQAVNNATADLNKMRRQLDSTESGLDGVSDATEEAGDAADSAGGQFGAFQVALGNLVSSGIQAALSAIGDLVGSLVNLDETTEEYRRAQGRLNTAFEAAGYGADTAQQAYQAFYGILGDTDTATEASQLLAKLAESEEDVATWTRIAAGVSGTFGDSLPIEGLIEAANETAKVGEVTGALADALNWAGISEDEFNERLAACSDESERNRLIMETLSGTYDEASDAFYRNNEALVASRSNQARMDETLSHLGETVAGVKNELTSEFMPALSDVAEAFNGLLNGTEGADEAFGEAIGELISTAVAKLPEFISFGTRILTSIVQGVLQSLPELLAAAPQIVGSVAQGIAQALPTILETGRGLIDQLIAGVTEGIPQFAQTFPEALQAGLSYITEQLPAVLDEGVKIVTSLADGILEGIPQLVAMLPEVITSIISFITENLPTILEAGAEILVNLVTGLIGAIPELIAALPEIILAITDGLAEAAPKIIKAGVELLQNLIEGLISNIPELVAALPQIITAIVTGIGNLMGGIIDVGKSIVTGIWEGITSMLSWLTDKIAGFFGGIVDGIKNFLGIHSPPTVFAGIGENMAAGIGEGFADQIRAVGRNMQASIPTPDMSFGSLAAGMVNGMQTAMAGGTAQPATIVLQLSNGREIARWLLPDIRAVEQSSPEVVSGV